MINFRKTKQDFAPAILKEGKTVYDAGKVDSVKISNMTSDSVRLVCTVCGNFHNKYISEIEINRSDSSVMDSDCDCPYNYDCHHLAAVLFYLEEHYDSLVVDYSKQGNIAEAPHIDEDTKEELLETFKAAETKQVQKQEKRNEKDLLQEYINASQVMGSSPYFQPEESLEQEKAELLVVLSPERYTDNSGNYHELRLALRLPFRSKPLHILKAKEFLDGVRYHESVYIGNRRFFFGLRSFDTTSAQIIRTLMDFARFPDTRVAEVNHSLIWIGAEALGTLLAQSYDHAQNNGIQYTSADNEQEYPVMPCLYSGHVEEPLRCSNFTAQLRFDLEHLELVSPKLLLKPSILVASEKQITIEEATIFESAKPGFLYENVYHRFRPGVKRKHLRNLAAIRNMTIPEPLFGTFVEICLPELQKYAEVGNKQVIDQFVTLPFVGKVTAVCDIHYLDGELEASLTFKYGKHAVPAAPGKIETKHVTPFVTDKGILARNLNEEQNIIMDLFQDFQYEERQGVYITKNEKRIVEFMTEVVPRNQERVTFNCPENLLDKFIYDDTTYTMVLDESEKVDSYKVTLKVEGHLKGFTVNHLWDCLASKRSFIELTKPVAKKKKGKESSSTQKILVLDLEKIAPVVQIFDEIGLENIDDHVEHRPLWSLASISEDLFKGLPIKFSMSKKLKEIQQQMLGVLPLDTGPIPETVQASLREYQKDGVGWLDRLRQMHLNGILADDMGLGKTLQAITAMTQFKENHPDSVSLVVCPTSLIYNWYEEIFKFNPKLKVLPVEGTPVQRKKLIDKVLDHDIVVTSYSLLQKDIEHYKQNSWGYVFLDEAQYIKNRGTRNAKSVKMLSASHKAILTGTPIENSLDELWSLFDFLMPGLLSSYDRFVEKYVRNTGIPTGESMEVLRKKVSPFILRRMKKDVLSELPPVSEIIYRCHLSDLQKELYKSYANSAREELSKLVHKEGFDKVQIQVLATLTRLKQICCHPAIFAKDSAEPGDSAKYDMLLELLQTLRESGHKTVIFSQYARMLGILRDELQRRGIRFSYLDGSTKNRMSIVKEFNEDEGIHLFLVSLKAGGTGLNLTSADTVIHYDMWWNPAVESQATDRVHRIGQKKNVSAYKLVTTGTIEEKIMELQNRKKGLVKKVISSDEEAMSKLTWEEVLELLQT
jgi:SNF2 family DNA or RNA helicase